MEKEEFAEEVVKSFCLALAMTMRDIEAAQPEKGFSALFMDLFKKKLEGAIAGMHKEV